MKPGRTAGYPLLLIHFTPLMLYGCTVSYKMKVQVTLRREAGAYRQMYGPRLRVVGDLHLGFVTKEGRRTPALQLLGADWSVPRLFEPRLVSLSADEMKFVGLEKCEDKWVLQQWDCVVL